MKCSDAEIRTNAANFFYATSAPGASGEMVLRYSSIFLGRTDNRNMGRCIKREMTR